MKRHGVSLIHLVSSPWIEVGGDLEFGLEKAKEELYIKKEEKREAKRNHYECIDWK